MRTELEARPPAAVGGRRARLGRFTRRREQPGVFRRWTTTTWDDRISAGRFREAGVEFRHVLDERPQDFWPNFYQGICAYRQGQFHDSLAAFRTCIALSPGSAECYYNRALAAAAMGRIDDAVRDYGRALELDPALWSASLNRGILAFKNGRNDEAIADFRQALLNASDERSGGLIHYNLALAYAARGDRKRALTAPARPSITGTSPPANSPKSSAATDDPRNSPASRIARVCVPICDLNVRLPFESEG